MPGPQEPMYAYGARLLATYPVLPLTEPRVLAIGASSYDGGVFYGLNADRDALPDADIVGQCVTEALEELVDTTRPGRSRAPRGRTREVIRITARCPIAKFTWPSCRYRRPTSPLR
ncbi:MAG: WSD1 family O-acyltransferase, partial [Actinomycetota bacterium]|nr:WSD1 family O-acyltransferase [Actinomycetota bacterium]